MCAHRILVLLDLGVIQLLLLYCGVLLLQQSREVQHPIPSHAFLQDHKVATMCRRVYCFLRGEKLLSEGPAMRTCSNVFLSHCESASRYENVPTVNSHYEG